MLNIMFLDLFESSVRHLRFVLPRVTVDQPDVLPKAFAERAEAGGSGAQQRAPASEMPRGQLPPRPLDDLLRPSEGRVKV